MDPNIEYWPLVSNYLPPSPTKSPTQLQEMEICLYTSLGENVIDGLFS